MANLMMSGFQNLGDIMKKVENGSKLYNKELTKSFVAKKKVTKITKKALPTIILTGAIMKGMGKAMGNVATMGLDMLGMFLQLGNAMGIIQPFMQMFQGIFGIMGGAAFGALGPVLQTIADTLFSSDMIEFWVLLGETIGTFLAEMMTMLVGILGDPKIKKLIVTAVTAIGSILLHLGKIFGVFMSILGGIDTHALGILIYVLAVTVAFFKGMAAAPGPAGLVLGAMMSVMVGIALAPLLALASGGVVTRPTIALLGEGGESEAVVPLSKAGDMGFGGGGEGSQVLWATEDNGRRLDRLIMAIEEQNRIKRMEHL